MLYHTFVRVQDSGKNATNHVIVYIEQNIYSGAKKHLVSVTRDEVEDSNAEEIRVLIIK